VLIKLPGILTDIMSTVIAQEHDMEVVGQSRVYTDIASAVSETGADAAIVGLHGDELPVACEEVLDRFPRLTLIAIAARGDRAFARILRPQTIRIGDVSSAGLVETIRRCARSPSPRRRQRC
jgi:hypothetical protein